MSIAQLSDESLNFPPVDQALLEPNGLLAVGGDLRPQRLLCAYQQGIFPWFNADDPILWWSPDPRAILFPADLHLSQSSRKFLRRSGYYVTINHAFSAVIHACAHRHRQESWITTAIEDAYLKLHQLHIAHSVEVWQDARLIGGLYGVNLGSLFCGESMFSLQDNASKCGLYAFCQHFIRHGGQLIDCQIINPHTLSLGAIEIARIDFLQYLAALQQQPLDQHCWQPQILELTY